jgi:hypothetical protein
MTHRPTGATEARRERPLCGRERPVLGPRAVGPARGPGGAHEGAPTGATDFSSGAVRWRSRSAAAVYIPHLRESTPASAANYRERRLAGDSL